MTPKQKTETLRKTFVEEFAEPLRTPYEGVKTGFTIAFPDTESEFIHELSGLIRKWKSRTGKEAITIAETYKNVLNQLLSPDTQ